MSRQLLSSYVRSASMPKSRQSYHEQKKQMSQLFDEDQDTNRIQKQISQRDHNNNNKDQMINCIPQQFNMIIGADSMSDINIEMLINKCNSSRAEEKIEKQSERMEGDIESSQLQMIESIRQDSIGESVTIHLPKQSVHQPNSMKIPSFKVDKTLSALASKVDETSNFISMSGVSYTSKEGETAYAQEVKTHFIPSSQVSLMKQRNVFAFRDQQAVNLPKEIFTTSDFLEELDISHNRFRILPNEISSLKYLKKLNLTTNFLRIIPVWLFQIIQLQELKISNNLLTEIPYNIINQNSMVLLDVSSNRITHLPNEIGLMKSLQYLNIASNEFITIPFSLRKLIDSSLKQLTLDWFKYCNPPLDMTQVMVECPSFIVPGADVISPLKKLSQLLLRAEQTIKQQEQENRVTSNRESYTERVHSKSIDSKLPFSGSISSRQESNQILIGKIEFSNNASFNKPSSVQDALHDQYHLSITDRKKPINKQNESHSFSTSIPQTSRKSEQLLESDILHDNLSKNKKQSPYPSNISNQLNENQEQNQDKSSVDSSFASCNYNSQTASRVPAQPNFTHPASLPIPQIKKTPLLSYLGFSGQNSNFSQQVGFQTLLINYSFKQFVFEMSSKKFQSNKKISQNQQTLLHLAAASEDLGALESLIQMDVTLMRELDGSSFSPLSVAINEEKYFAAKKLLQQGADPSFGGGIFGTPLNIATIKGQLFLLQDLLNRKVVAVNTPDLDGNTSMHYIMTVFSRDFEASEKIANLLLEAGCDPNIKNIDGWSPIHLAIRRSQIGAVRFAIQHNRKIFRLQQQQQYPQSQSQLRSLDSIKFNSINSLQCNGKSFDFLQKGGDDKQSCLHISCLHNDVNMTKILLESDMIDFFAVNNLNQTAHSLPPKGNLLSKYLRKYLKEMLENDIQGNNQPFLLPKNAVAKVVVGSSDVLSPKEHTLSFNFQKKLLLPFNSIKKPSSLKVPNDNQDEEILNSSQADDDDINMERSHQEDSQGTQITDLDEYNAIQEIQQSKQRNSFQPLIFAQNMNEISWNSNNRNRFSERSCSQNQNGTNLEKRQSLTNQEVNKNYFKKVEENQPNRINNSCCSNEGLFGRLKICKQSAKQSIQEEKLYEQQISVPQQPNSNFNHLPMPMKRRRKAIGENMMKCNEMYHFVNGQFDELKVQNKVMKYQNGDEGNCLNIPKLLSVNLENANTSKLQQQRVSNIIQLFDSSSKEYKQSLEQGVQNISDQFRLLVYIINNFNNCRNRINISSISDSLISAKYGQETLLSSITSTIKSLLTNINTQQSDYSQLMKFVEDNNNNNSSNSSNNKQLLNENKPNQTKEIAANKFLHTFPQNIPLIKSAAKQSKQSDIIKEYLISTLIKLKASSQQDIYFIQSLENNNNDFSLNYVPSQMLLFECFQAKCFISSQFKVRESTGLFERGSQTERLTSSSSLQQKNILQNNNSIIKHSLEKVIPTSIQIQTKCFNNQIGASQTARDHILKSKPSKERSESVASSQRVSQQGDIYSITNNSTAANTSFCNNKEQNSSINQLNALNNSSQNSKIQQQSLTSNKQQLLAYSSGSSGYSGYLTNHVLQEIKQPLSNNNQTFQYQNNISKQTPLIPQDSKKQSVRPPLSARPSMKSRAISSQQQ